MTDYLYPLPFREHLKSTRYVPSKCRPLWLAQAFGFMVIEFIIVHVYDMLKKVEQGYFGNGMTVVFN